MHLRWQFHHPRASDYHVGYIGAGMLDNTDAKAAAQINDLYPFGGWKPFGKGQWRTNFTAEQKIRDIYENHFLPTLTYPGDPPMEPIASAIMVHPEANAELICVYQSYWWAIFQQDGSFEVCRLD